MDIDALKGRIAEALVEGIFRRAEYHVALVGRESRVQQLIKLGKDQFLPDFLVWKSVAQPGRDRPLHRMISIEVKYRADISEYLRLYFSADFSSIADHWPNLYLVFVTDHPEEGRSCFQVIDLWQYSPDGPMVTFDLAHVSELDIYRKNVEEHEGLAKQIFPLLNSQPRTEDLPRKPPAKVAGDAPSLRAAR